MRRHPEALPEGLTPDGIPLALEWIEKSVPPGGTLSFSMERLHARLFALAWEHVEQSTIANALIDAMIARLRDGGSVFRSLDDEKERAFSDCVRENENRRREFLLEVCKRRLTIVDAFGLQRIKVVSPEDFEWLLAKCPGGMEFDSELDEDSLLILIDSVRNWDNPTNFECLYAAAKKWPRLWERNKLLFEGVPLDSREAHDARETQRLMRSMARDDDEELRPPPAERVEELLLAFDSGNLDAFWQLHLVLTIDPIRRSQGHDYDLDITEMPGWRAAGDKTKLRILSACEIYLRDATPQVDAWIGTTSFRRSDFAAYRAFLLLRGLRADMYKKIDRAIWNKWCSTLVAVSGIASNGEEPHGDLLKDAAAYASAEFAKTVILLIASERMKTAAGERDIGETGFSIIGKLDKCWDNSELRAAVAGELDDAANTPAQFGALLRPLLGHHDPRARASAIAMLRDAKPERRDFAIRAAAIALSVADNALWADVWPFIANDQTFGEEVFSWIADHDHFEEAFAVRLAEATLAELFIWLARAYPHKNDRPVTGEAEWVDTRERNVHLRDAVLQALVDRGTEAAVSALRSVVAAIPELTWLVRLVHQADDTMRRKTWVPLTPGEVLRYVGERDAALIRSDRDLFDLLLEMLRKYESELHSAQTPVQDLWHKQKGGMWIPVDENGFSDHVTRYLKRELGTRGVVVNREVEVGRVPGAPVGDRTDIKVDSWSRAPGGGRGDTVTVVIEAKGSWNAELREAIANQLRDNYLRRFGARYGIYLVAWFDAEKWDDNDKRRRAAATRTSYPDLQSELDVFATSSLSDLIATRWFFEGRIRICNVESAD